jgi:hypothetical protein
MTQNLRNFPVRTLCATRVHAEVSNRFRTSRRRDTPKAVDRSQNGCQMIFSVCLSRRFYLSVTPMTPCLHFRRSAQQLRPETARSHMVDTVPSKHERVHRQTQRRALLVTTKRLLPGRPLKIPHSRIGSIDCLPATARLNLRGGINIPSSPQVHSIGVRVLSAGETGPVVYSGLCEWRIVWVSFRQSEASPCAED